MARIQFKPPRDSVYAESTAFNDTKAKDHGGDEDALANSKRQADSLAAQANAIDTRLPSGRVKPIHSS